MAGTVNKTLLRKEIFGNRGVKKIARNAVLKKVQFEKVRTIAEYSNHPVTQELDAGGSASNSSGTLGGYGNLFSFIGFNDNDKPTGSVKKLLKTITVATNVKTKNKNFTFQIIIPSKEDFALATRNPWESGRSWLFDIERGISGLGSYLYGSFQESRSGKGLQLRNKYKNTRFRPVKYFSSIYNGFIKRVGAGSL